MTYHYEPRPGPDHRGDAEMAVLGLAAAAAIGLVVWQWKQRQPALKAHLGPAGYQRHAARVLSVWAIVIGFFVAFQGGGLIVWGSLIAAAGLALLVFTKPILGFATGHKLLRELPPPMVMSPTSFVPDDGGRAAAGYSGQTRDCVTRAVAIATGRPYRVVHNDLNCGTGSPEFGVQRDLEHKYLLGLGWTWHSMAVPATFGVETSATGRAILVGSEHIAALVDGSVHDTFDSRGTRLLGCYLPPR